MPYSHSTYAPNQPKLFSWSNSLPIHTYNGPVWVGYWHGCDWSVSVSFIHRNQQQYMVVLTLPSANFPLHGILRKNYWLLIFIKKIGYWILDIFSCGFHQVSVCTKRWRNKVQGNHKYLWKRIFLLFKFSRPLFLRPFVVWSLKGNKTLFGLH